MKKSIYNQAVELRKQGWSYGVIIDRLGVSKSTLSNWLSRLPYTPNATVKQRIKEGPEKSATRRHQKKLDSVTLIHKQAVSELGEMNERDLWMLGIGLYLGEGTKKFEEVRFVNTDPKIIHLMVLWLKKICGVPKQNIQLRIHGYPDTDFNESRKYWQSITGLTQSAFVREQIDVRKNKKITKWKTSPYGTLHVIVRKYGKTGMGVVLHRRIMGWIQGTCMNAGIV